MIKATQSRPASPAIRPITATLLHASLKKLEGCLTRSACTVRFNGANRLPLFVFCTATRRRKNASKRPTYIPGDTRVALTNSTSVAHRWRSNQGEHTRSCLPLPAGLAPAGCWPRLLDCSAAHNRQRVQPSVDSLRHSLWRLGGAVCRLIGTGTCVCPIPEPC